MNLEGRRGRPSPRNTCWLSGFWALKMHLVLAFIPWNLSNPDPHLNVGETRPLRSERLPDLSVVCSREVAETGLNTQHSLTAESSDSDPGYDQIMMGLPCCEKEPETI